MFRLLASGLAAYLLSFSPAFAQEDHPGKASFQRCAACHLADGAGVPGAFPALRGNVQAFVASEQGRDYLTYVVRKGVQGALTVDGATYYGVMPAVTSDLKDADLAALLNYLVTQVAPGGESASPETPPFTPFTAEEIAARTASVLGAHTHQNILELRAEAIAAPIEKPPVESE